jgi:hypothetical protein
MDFNSYNYCGPQYNFDPAMEPQVYGGTSEHNGWNTNMIDPNLLNDDGMGPFSSGIEQGHPVQRWQREPEKAWFSVPHMPTFQAPISGQHINFIKPYEHFNPIPNTFEYPGDSPSSTESSSAFSPPPESEAYHESYHQRSSFDSSSPFPSSLSHLSQGPQDSYPINMSQNTVNLPDVIRLADLQGVPDPQETTYHDDDNYNYDLAVHLDFDVKTDLKSGRVAHFHQQSDPAIRQSIKDEEESKSTIIVDTNVTGPDADVEPDSDMDADAEDDDGTIEVLAAPDIDSDIDPEFTPGSRRNPKRRRAIRPSPSSQATPSKRSRIGKAILSTTSNAKTNSGKNKCPTCPYSTKDQSTLAKHIAVQHTRPYVCTFAFAGCSSTFGNKNEWKRHVQSQHLGLQVWVCTMGACGAKSNAPGSSAPPKGPGKAGSVAPGGGAEFNRKDLFTQHLRRMHAPINVKRKGQTDARWEATVKEWQVSCLQKRRDPPTKTRCPVQGCGEIFEGHNGWDERMEHVGRHLEKVSSKTQVTTVEEDDEFLMKWALGEGIIEQSRNGYIFGAGRGHANDVDAEGDDDEDFE